MSVRVSNSVFLTVFIVIAIGASSAFAACPKSSQPCNPPAFTGSVHAQPALCEKPSNACQGKRGPAGPRGIRGKRGATGAVGLQGISGERGLAGAAGPAGTSGIDGIAGAAGVTGATGAMGPQGVAGATGSTGDPGVTGETGATGLTGLLGQAGPTGPTGDQGPAGADGLDGNDGANGTDGADGSDGADGPQGATGATGPAGTNGTNGTNATAGIDSFAYIYNLGAQTVPVGAPVTFDNNGELGLGIVHSAGDAGVTFSDSGVYEIQFSVSGTEPNQMGLFINGVPVNGSVYGSGAGTQQNSGQVILALGAGDVLTLNNFTSAAAVGLATPIGGIAPSVNASLMIVRLN